MRLDRVNGKQKYGLIKVRKLDEYTTPGQAGYGHRAEIESALELLEQAGIIDWGATPETEFFVIRLKDNNAAAALYHYAKSAFLDDAEYGRDVMDLAKRSGPMHPNCRKPD